MYGPPGTGKTTYVARQLEAAEAAGREPFVASFTRAAAAELAGRAALPRARVGTLHALCYAMLDRPNIAEEHVKDFKGSLSRGSREALDEGDGPTYASEDDRLLGEYNLLRQRMITKDRWPAWVREFAARWEDWKRENDYLDFTDLISVVYDSGLPPPGRLGFFDEAQDMTPLDFALARQWGEHYLDDVVFVGDEDQTIYEWRGATPQGLLDPPLPEGSVRVLGQSYRLPASVHTYATEWIERVARRADKPFAPRAEQGAMTFAPHLTDAGGLADTLEELSGDATALLLASCSYMLRDTVAELRRRGALVHHPWRREKAVWNPLGAATGGSTRARVLRMLAPQVTGRPWTYGDVDAFLDLVKLRGVTRRGARSTVKKQHPEQQVSEAALLDLFEDDVRIEIEVMPMEFLLRHAATRRAGSLDYLAAVAKRHGLDALVAPEPRITLGTIHSLKGGEADHVVVVPDISRAAADSRAQPGGDDALTRQFYVAFTRARHSLTLAGSRSSNRIHWPSPR